MMGKVKRTLPCKKIQDRLGLERAWSVGAALVRRIVSYGSTADLRYVSGGARL
jgi:hypothetical protein